MTRTALFAITLLGPLTLVATVLTIVFSLVRRAVDRAAAALANEGVVLDSGPLTLTTRYRSFRSAAIYSSSSIQRVPGRIVLTNQRLHLLRRPQRYGVFERSELPKLSVDVFEGMLRIHSDDPPNASGHVDFRAPVTDPQAWLKALVEAGAKPG